MPELHTRLLADVIALGSPYPLVLTGGYAVRAHRLVNHPSQALDVATENPAPMADIATVPIHHAQHADPQVNAGYFAGSRIATHST